MNDTQKRSMQIVGSTVIFLLLNIICLSCSKDENPEINNSIVGKWFWLETCNAWTEIKYTPGSEGYTRALIFRNDNIVESYKNEELLSAESYITKEVVYEPGNPDSEITLILIMNESESYFSVDNDTLILSQAHLDGPVSIYERKE